MNTRLVGGGYTLGAKRSGKRPKIEATGDCAVCGRTKFFFGVLFQAEVDRFLDQSQESRSE